jgi:catechol 2,3-dioxygenase-like lactoylglutathione lyase family enzyme
MAINPNTAGIHHICLRSTDFNLTKNFYRDIIGFSVLVDAPELLIFALGNIVLAFKKSDPRDKKYSSFSPFEVGLDHIAIASQTEEELHRFTKGLVDAGVENTGVKTDPVLNKLYVAFKDPDRIQWEFYMV